MKLMIDDKHRSMPWAEVDTVVFDVGNVLLSFEPRRVLEEYVPEAPELYDDLTLHIFKSPYWCMQDRGSATPQEVTDAMVLSCPNLEPYIRRVMAHWVEMKHVIDEGVEALRMCKAHGKKLVVLSNYGDEAFSIVDAKYDFFRLFDGMVISSRVHMVKPEPAIYAEVIRRFSLDPARTLFIDDSMANIEAALEAGWQGLCFNAPGKLRAFIGA